MKYCEEFEALLDLYADSELEVADMIRVQEHLDTCPACRAYVDELLAIRAAFPEIEDTTVPEGFAEGVMAAIATSAPKAKKRPTPWKKVLIPMAACLAVVVMVLPMAGLMNNARMESAAPAEAPAAAVESYIADAAVPPTDAPAEMVMEAPAEAPMPEEAQDIHYAYTTAETPAETEEAPASATGAESRIGNEEGVTHDAVTPEPFAGAKQQSVDPRAVITLPPEGANLELLVGRAADRQTDSHMEFDLPLADYEMLLIQLDESGFDYLLEEYPASAGDTILVIIELEQVQQN